jgi:hypothetical protein
MGKNNLQKRTVKTTVNVRMRELVKNIIIFVIITVIFSSNDRHSQLSFYNFIRSLGKKYVF